jgi:type I restriction-modification system DNA methylase subunit
MGKAKSKTTAKRALQELTHWTTHSEQDLYFYVKEFFIHVLGYPRNCVVICEPGKKGTPDISLCSADSKPSNKIYWAVGEVKQKPGLFRDPRIRKERWDKQLSRYVTADSVFSFLLDPLTIAVLHPNGEEIKVVALDQMSVEDVRSESNLNFLGYSNSIGEKSLLGFAEGASPSKYIDVRQEEGKNKFYETLRVCAQELIDYSTNRLKDLSSDYKIFKQTFNKMRETAPPTDQVFNEVVMKLEKQHRESIYFFDQIFPAFQQQVGKTVPKREEDARKFQIEVYATEGASLILARILFIRFFEDHGLVTKKISNSGIKAFRQYYSYVRDDYRFLLTSAYRDLDKICHRLFEESIFDFASEGDGRLSKILLRIFYRLNAFDFAFITGDILGNLYERFLEPNRRKKLGEYYTPMAVAKYVLNQIGFFDNPGSLLDPACGSGSFLIAALTGLIQKLQERGIDLEVAIRQSIELVHGLDINVFAAFIAQMQLTWHLFPYLKIAKLNQIPEFKVYGGINSLIYQPQRTLIAALLMETAETAKRIRDGRYDYIVGNPPYIRNERLKDHGEWRKLYDAVDFRNSDICFFFVARALMGGRASTKKVQPLRMPSWLKESGRMCFVLPMGLCDSAAASVLRTGLLNYKILELTDLEEVAIHLFPSPQASGRATTAPVLLFVEKSEPNEKNLINIVSVPESGYEQRSFDETQFKSSRVPQEFFHSNEINPNGQFLTKLVDQDIPILQKIMSHSSIEKYSIPPTPSYGIKIGRKGKLYHEFNETRLPIGKGLNISMFHLDKHVTRWVDISQVESKSIWGKSDLPQEAYVLSGITLAPQCANFNSSDFAFNDSARVLIPKAEYADFPWDSLINSSIIRFVHLLTLRSGLVGVGTKMGNDRRAAWCVLYPRVITNFPVPERLVKDPGKLAEIAVEIRKIAGAIANRWKIVNDTISNSSKKPLVLFNIDFGFWKGDLPTSTQFKLTLEDGKWVLRAHIKNQTTLLSLTGPRDLLNVVRYLLCQKAGNLKTRDLQELQVPEDISNVSALIDNANNPESIEIGQFMELFAEADKIIAKAFELSTEEVNYIRNRISTPPLDVLQPRWPWMVSEKRGIQEYESDRFA